MSLLTILVLLASFIVMIVTGIMCIVAAFRQSIVWGLVYLFVPFGSLVFIILHWHDVRSAFLTNLAAAVVFVLAIWMSPVTHDAIAKALQAGSMNKGRQLTAQIDEQRERIERLRDEYTRANVEVVRLYKDLTEKRKKLNAADAEATHQFNVEVSAYQNQNAHVNQLKHDMESAAEEVSRLLAERAKEVRENGPAGRQVVIYTTSTCPACKMAKDYFAEKGISYREIDVNESRDGFEEFHRLGGTKVPLIIVGGEKMEGFSRERFDSLLGN